MRVPVVRRALLTAGIVTVAGASALGLGMTATAVTPTALVARAADPTDPATNPTNQPVPKADLEKKEEPEPTATFSPAKEPDTQTAPPPSDPPEPTPPGVNVKTPLPATTPGTDPCAAGGINGIPSSVACTDVEQNKQAKDKCQVEQFHQCNAPISGEAQRKQEADQDNYVQKQADFENVTRSAAPNEGVKQQCDATSGMRDRLTDEHVIVPHSSWWEC
ncbi:hypothetical protein [Streptomyces huasconensis]|uniref:hypothetical protein n=1 Tax=Streptomyces huasconensis TaxID=1854574 RepID=UPI0033EFBA94